MNQKYYINKLIFWNLLFISILSYGTVFAQEEQNQIPQEDLEQLEYWTGEWTLVFEREGMEPFEQTESTDFFKEKNNFVFKSKYYTGIKSWAGEPGKFRDYISFDDGGYYGNEWTKISPGVFEGIGEGVTGDGKIRKLNSIKETISPNKWILKIKEQRDGEKQPDLKITFTRNDTNMVLSKPAFLNKDWTPEEKKIWDTIEQQWNTFLEDDIYKCMSFFHPEFLGWGNDVPMPLNTSDVKKRAEFYMKSEDTLMINLKPISIKTYGNVAIAHYYFEDVYKDAEGKLEDRTGRFTDILMEEDGKWLFISYQGEPDSKD